MALNFSVCSYNMGSSANDYFVLCKRSNPEFTIQSKEAEAAFRETYQKTEAAAAQKLLELSADVYCLQEVVEKSRPLVQSLEQAGFHLVSLEGGVYFDPLIALKASRFKNVTNHSCNISITEEFRKDVAIATATDIETGQKVAFVSAHVPGFDFVNPDPTQIAEGDFYCGRILERLKQIGVGAIQVIGADMNANPERGGSRFRLLTDHHFDTVRTGSATNLNIKDPIHQEREIDFIFMRAVFSLWNLITSLFFKTMRNTISIQQRDPLGWKADSNASDHIPIFATVHTVVVDSLIVRIWNAIALHLPCCRRST